jgi:pseudaminic acid cytidylyltransferase
LDHGFKVKRIAIIPARGGSKRIPRKNIIEFHGKPIMAYSIEAALSSKLFDEVMVSTEDNEIQKIALKYGASVPFLRSARVSDDFATTADVIAEVLDNYTSKLGVDFDSFCCIYATAPFVTAQKLSEAHELYAGAGAGSLVTVVKYGFPPQRAFTIIDGRLGYIDPENRNTRSQDLTPIYHDAGQFYWGVVSQFRDNRSLVSEDALPFIVPETEVQDIDDLIDLELAKLKFIQIYKGNDT